MAGMSGPIDIQCTTSPNHNFTTVVSKRYTVPGLPPDVPVLERSRTCVVCTLCGAAVYPFDLNVQVAHKLEEQA